MQVGGYAASQTQGSQDMAMGSLENRRNKSEQWGLKGDRGARGCGGRADGSYTLANMRPKPTKFLFISSHLASYLPYSLQPAPSYLSFPL